MLAGNSKLMELNRIAFIDCHSVGTIIHMAIDGEYAGHIVISDVVKPHAKEAIERLKHSGVEKTVMLTGDTRRVAEQVAKDLGVDEVHSDLLPADKVAQVEKLLAAKGDRDKLAFVGDGINDAPVLSRADIGIATVSYTHLEYNAKRRFITTLQTVDKKLFSPRRGENSFFRK